MYLKGYLILFGFTAGDGSFNLKIGKSNTTSIGVIIQLRFGIGLHIRELDLIKGIADYFNLLIPLPIKEKKSIADSQVKIGKDLFTQCSTQPKGPRDNCKYKYIEIR